LILSVILQGFGAIISFATTALIFRSLTKDDAGLFSLVSSYLIVTISFIDFGIIATVYPKISLANGTNSPIFKAGFILRCVTIFLGFVGINLYLILYNKSDLLLYVNLFFGVALFSSKASGLRQFFEAVLRLKGRTYLVSTISLIDGVIGIVSILILKFYNTLTLFNIFLILGSSSILGFLIVSLPLFKFLINEKVFKYNIKFKYYKSIILTTLPIALMSVIGQLFSQVETFIISGHLSNSDIAGYNAAFRPFQGIVFVPVMLSIGIAPVVTQLYKTQRNDIKMESLLEFVFKVFLLISLTIL
jgi:O-antigen/teichoic acid export membrane protein